MGTDNKNADLFSEQVKKKADRKIKALHNNNSTTWLGLGMFGMVGWSVAVPTLLGAILGIWLDKKYPESFSWTLTCLMIGLFSGCLIAWHWISKEHTDLNENNND